MQNTNNMWCKSCVIHEICGLYRYTYKLNLRFMNFKPATEVTEFSGDFSVLSVCSAAKKLPKA